MRRMKTSGGTTSGTTFIDLEDVKVPIENLIGQVRAFSLSNMSLPTNLSGGRKVRV